MKLTTVNYPFLRGGGEMGEIIRSFNWSETSLGSPDGWPQSLRIALGIILNSRLPMFLFWGPELIQFYNDAYYQILGKNARHFDALGTSGYNTSKEMREAVGSIIGGVMENAESFLLEDQLIQLYRNGQPENVYMTYSYSPLNNEHGISEGVFVTCYESTQKIKAFKDLQDTMDMYEFAIDAADLGIWEFDLAKKSFTVNSRLCDWFKLSGKHIDFDSALKLVAKPERRRVLEAVKAVLNNVNDGVYDIEHSIICEPGADRKRIRVKGKVLFDSEGQPYRFNGTVQDITRDRSDRQGLIESENHLRNLFSQIPAAISIFKGPDFIIEVVNDIALEYWQKSYDEVINRPLFEAVPVVAGTGYEQLLRRVFESGERYEGKELGMEFPRNGTVQKVYINFIYEPYVELDGTISGVMVIANEVTEQVVIKKEIQESEQRYHYLVEQAPVATAIYLGAEMKIQMANDAMLKLWGKPASVIGMDLADALPELEDQPFLELLKKVYTTGETYWGKHDRVQLVINGALQTGYFNFTYKALRNTEGKIYGVLNMAIDVTEMVIARRLLEVSENNFKTMILQAPVAMCVLSGADLVVEVANEKMFELWGKTSKEILQKPIFDGLPEARGQGLEEILRSVYESGEGFTASELPVYLPRNGKIELTYLNFIYEAIEGEPASTNRILAVAIDVTDQVLSRNKAEESEKEFRQMANSMPQIVWTARPEGVVDYFNKQWYDYTGFSRDFDDLSLIPILHPNDTPDFLKNWNKAVKEGSDFEIEVRFADRKRDSYIWYLCRATAIRDADDRIIKWFGTSTDIDDQKKQQQQKDEFISVASHELKTPLTTLKAGLQLMSRVIKTETTSEKLRNLVEKSNFNLSKLSSLVDDLLSSTKIEQGQLSLSKSVFSVSGLIDECCDHVRLEGVHQLITTGDTSLQVYADRQKLDQVLVNLVNNAVKYAPGSDKILINISKEDGMVKVTVEDFGIGIPSEKLPFLFDRFYRVDVSGVQYSGLGLGLYISSEIVKRHGGVLGVESVAGQGSKFWFTIPSLT